MLIKSCRIGGNEQYDKALTVRSSKASSKASSKLTAASSCTILCYTYCRFGGSEQYDKALTGYDIVDVVHIAPVSPGRSPSGPHFPCFTSTKVPILTQKRSAVLGLVRLKLVLSIRITSSILLYQHTTAGRTPAYAILVLIAYCSRSRHAQAQARSACCCKGPPAVTLTPPLHADSVEYSINRMVTRKLTPKLHHLSFYFDKHRDFSKMEVAKSYRESMTLPPMYSSSPSTEPSRRQQPYHSSLFASLLR